MQSVKNNRLTNLHIAYIFLLIIPSIILAQSKKNRQIESHYLKLADKNIEKYRKGYGSIKFIKKSGIPIQLGKIKITQKKHHFYFGSLLNIQYHSNPYYPERYKYMFKDMMNFATIEMYWGMFERYQGKPRYIEIEEILDWCGSNDIAVIGHALVWNH